MKPNVAVIGSHSFSGNAFATQILQNSPCLLVSRSSSLQHPLDGTVKAPFKSPENGLVWNINDDPEKVIEAIRKNEISTIVNFAAQSMVGESWQHPEDWYQTNVVGLSRFLNRVREETNVRKFIQFTTPEVYGTTQGWIKESFQFSPSTPYAVSRAAGDWHLRCLFENYGFPVIYTRAANVYGERQALYRIIPKVIYCALTGRKIPLQGGGRSIRSFIHSHDVNSALSLVIEKGVPGETYHISTNETISIYHLVLMISDRLGIEIRSLIENVEERPGKDYAYQLDSSKIRTELGWRDEVSLLEGIDRTIKWMTDNLESVKTLPIEYEHRR